MKDEEEKKTTKKAAEADEETQDHKKHPLRDEEPEEKPEVDKDQGEEDTKPVVEEVGEEEEETVDSKEPSQGGQTLEDLAQGEDSDTTQEQSDDEEPRRFKRTTSVFGTHSTALPGTPRPPMSSQFYNSPPRQQSSANVLHLIILAVIGALVIGATVYLLKGDFNFLAKPAVTPSPAPQVSLATPAPTEAPAPALDRSEFTIRILNGSGKTGLAKEVSEKLKELGYEIEKTGNATNSAFEKTLVRIKGDNTPLGEQLIKDLAPDFAATTSSPLKSTDVSDAEVILGLE